MRCLFMGEYNDSNYSKDSKDKEISGLKNFEKFNEEIDDDFVPLEETPAFKAGCVDTFEPKDEKDDNHYVFEADFTPKDEKNSGRNQNSESPKVVKVEKSDKKIVKEKGSEFSQRIGSISEMILIKDLEKSGKNVAVPYGDFQKYDLLYEENNKISRVQVKTANEKNERFYTKSISKGLYKNYTGEIDYYGVFNRKDNNSYLIPFEKIEEIDNIVSVKLNQNLKKNFRIHQSLKKESFDDLKNDMAVKLVKEGKIVLNHLGNNYDNKIIYDDIKKTEKKGIKHNIREITVGKRNINHNDNFGTPSDIEVARVNVAADLMSNGYIISTPIRNNPQYDFIIQNKYAGEGSTGKKNFKKVKVTNNPTEIMNSNIREEKLDYLGIYDRKNDKSYLIPTKKLKEILKNLEKFEIQREQNLLNSMSANDKGEAIELRIGAEFMKKGYKVFHPKVGRAVYDLVAKKNDTYYTIQVKAGITHNEKESTYVRFNTARKKNKANPRANYKGEVDFIAIFNPLTSKAYIIPTEKLPDTDGKIKLDERPDMRQMHHGTIMAKNYEFDNVDRIIQQFEKIKQERKRFEHRNQDIKKQPQELRKRLENEQILSTLQGNIKIDQITSSNSILQRYSTEFKRNFPKSQIEYQGILSVSFRDFLIEQPELKPIINNMMKKQGLYGENEVKHRKVYDFIDDFYNDKGRTPNSLELYQKFLNFKGYELRGKIYHSRKKNPDYNKKDKLKVEVNERSEDKR